MKTIMRLMLAVSAFASGLCFDIRPTHAYYGDAPWCAVISTGDDGKWDCQYRTLEECVPQILAGNRGTCNPNPWYTPNTVAPRKHHR
jgi:hypothetical protein